MDKMMKMKLPARMMEAEKQPLTMTKKGAYAAVSYMTTAVLLVMFNKEALSSYGFPHANAITPFQIICSSSFLYALRSRKVISFRASTDGNPEMLVPFKTLIRTLPVAIMYLLYMLASIRINVPMYTTRRTTAAFTMLMECLLTGQKYSLPVVVR